MALQQRRRTARHPHQHGRPPCRPTSPRRSRPAARRRPASRPTRQHAFDQLDDFYKHGLGYAHEMSNRPQTLYGIADSPVGLAAWMLDHDVRSYAADRPRRSTEQTEGLTRDDVLDNVTLYWLTNTGDLVGAPLLGERTQSAGGFFDPSGVKIPVAVSAFPDEIYPAPRSWAEQAYPKLIHYNKLAEGRPLRRLGAAGHLRLGDARQLQVAALTGINSRRTTLPGVFRRGVFVWRRPASAVLDQDAIPRFGIARRSDQWARRSRAHSEHGSNTAARKTEP